MPKHTLYFSDKVYNSLEIDLAGAEGLSARVSTLCSYAVTLLRQNVPALKFSEWGALLDISNGQVRAFEPDHSSTVDSFAFSVAASGPECNAKWGVKCARLAEKFRALQLVEQLAVIEVCRRFWINPEVNAKFDNYRDMLTAHGAKFDD